MSIAIRPGRPLPLGATLDTGGVNFSVFSSVADRVELCLVDDAGAETRVDLPGHEASCFHGYVPGLRPGQRYGLRVHGPNAPDRGLFCDPSRLVLDPYARAIENLTWSVVVDPAFDWGGDVRPDRPLAETVIYELHVRGFTRQHPEVPADLRGTYAALADPHVITHLTALGVTAVELLPVHQFVHDQRLLQMGLRNYWGYNTIGYMAPHAEYSHSGARGQQVTEFKQMVRALHAAGLEVILDVVFNHTAEGGAGGPVLCFRGFDNPAYYRLDPTTPSIYYDDTGTGNTVNMRHPYVLQLVMDSLRYWVSEMHVDGFRFDECSTLARTLYDVDRLSPFFELIQQDPVVGRVKLIAEPWDVGPGGYQLGNFPWMWSEWNGRYRDTLRDYWRGTPGALPDMATRFAGSSDLYDRDGRLPTASVNFITAHDGFTLRDLVSYDGKHNDANGEGNRDGNDDNRSWNCGVEGATDDPGVLALRARQVRNLLTTLVLATGVPMITAGDELGRTQQGNNNAYCQDNATSWIDWGTADTELLAFTRRLIALRAAHPVLRRASWFTGAPTAGGAAPDIAWLRPDAQPMGGGDWNAGFNRAVAVVLDGRGVAGPGPDGTPVVDRSVLVLLNAAEVPVTFTLPPCPGGGGWIHALRTGTGAAPAGTLAPAATVGLDSREAMVLEAES